MLEGCDGPCGGSDTSLILSDWYGVHGIVSISGGGVAAHTFGDIVPLLQTYMSWIFCELCKELKIY